MRTELNAPIMEFNVLTLRLFYFIFSYGFGTEWSSVWFWDKRIIVNTIRLRLVQHQNKLKIKNSTKKVNGLHNGIVMFKYSPNVPIILQEWCYFGDKVISNFILHRLSGIVTIFSSSLIVISTIKFRILNPKVMEINFSIEEYTGLIPFIYIYSSYWEFNEWMSYFEQNFRCIKRVVTCNWFCHTWIGYEIWNKTTKKFGKILWDLKITTYKVFRLPQNINDE